MTQQVVRAWREAVSDAVEEVFKGRLLDCRRAEGNGANRAEPKVRRDEGGSQLLDASPEEVLVAVDDDTLREGGARSREFL